MNPRNRTFLIVGAVIVLILVAAGIAVLATGSDDVRLPATSPAIPSSRRARSRWSARRCPSTTRRSPTPRSALASPVVTGEQFDGTPISIGGPADGPTLLVFLAHWCPHCNAEIPELIELEEAGEIPEELGVIGISTAVASDRPNYPPSEWIVEKGWPWPTMADNEQSDAFLDFGGSGFPFLVMLDADGTVLARQSGESTAEQIKLWIDAALA